LPGRPDVWLPGRPDVWLPGRPDVWLPGGPEYVEVKLLTVVNVDDGLTLMVVVQASGP
jgi:hypothetical protein